jgi:DNA-directed RNA polymerase subunit RPC12/RpoP
MKSLRELVETICPQCERKFMSMSIKGDKKPNCFYCELKRYPHPENPDYRDVAAARISSGTHTKEQEKIYWEGVLKRDPMPVFPGFPEEFEIPQEEMIMEMVPLTEIPISITIEEFEKSLKEFFKNFISASEVVYDSEGDLFVLTLPDFIKSEDNPLLWLNLKYIQRLFATVSEKWARELGKKIELGIRFLKYPQFDFKAMGY